MRDGSSDTIKSVGIWLRVSTEDQVRGESPEHHEQRARAYAELKGWHVAEVYRLDAVSGKAVMGHADAKRMLSDIRSGVITGLVFSKLARLARNTKELLEFAEIFRVCNADMISLAESIDTSTPAGRLFFTMIAAMAQWEREEIADRVSASVPVRAKLGKTTGGAAPYGYRYVDKKLEAEPAEAPIRALMYELFDEHKRRKTVARLLNDRGYRTRKGNKWTDTSLVRLLQDPITKGLRRANYTHTTDNKKAWQLKPESEWVYFDIDPIVSEELWERCNGLIAAQQTGQRRPLTKRAIHLFAGFAHCQCGGVMYVPSKSTKYVCQTCRNKIPTDDLEEVFRERLNHFLFSTEEMDAHRVAAQEALRERAQLIDTVEAELGRLEAEEKRILQLYYADTVTTDDFRRLHKPVSERRAQIDEELPRLRAELDVLRISSLSHEVAVSDAQSLASQWSGLTAERRREIVEAITDRITVGTEEVEVSLLHLPSGTDSEMATHRQGFWAATSWNRAG